jgi:hypothetical protein
MLTVHSTLHEGSPVAARSTLDRPYQLPLAPRPDEKPPPEDELEEDDDENERDDDPLDQEDESSLSLGRVRRGVWTMRLSWRLQFRQWLVTSSRPPWS